MTSDPVLENSWLAALNVADLAPGRVASIRLLDQDVVLWRTDDGALQAASDQCPHRGTRLSLGEVRGEELMCPYHGWRFDGGGNCTYRPAQPSGRVRESCLPTYATCERYGVAWICLGDPPDEPDWFPEFNVPESQSVHHSPRLVQASGPRIIENFLDMAHFPFVHAGTLGAEPHTEVRDYVVTVTERGVEAVDCVFWQPASGPTAGTGGDVTYAYRVVHPFVATLTKIPIGEAPGFSLMLVASPVDEVTCRAWMTGVFSEGFEAGSFHDFNEGIFDEDIPILESQRPQRMPLDPGAEMHQRADKVSAAYRQYLQGLGLTYGVVPAVPEKGTRA